MVIYMKLEVKNLKKQFNGTEILHGISFSVESGKALGLLGRNGAGKTTTIRIIMDVFEADSGSILLDGNPFRPFEHSIGYLPEERGMYPRKKVLEQIVYFAGLRGLSSKQAKLNAKHWLKRLGIEEYENRKLETLSKGNQQKVQLAQTLICNPDIIILDEPFSGLDPVNSQILKEVVSELITDGHVVIFSSHQMNYVEEFCEEIAIIHHGEIVLNGNLMQIKQKFGQNRLILSASDLDSTALKQVMTEHFSSVVAVTQTQKDYLILQLLENQSKASFLQKLLDSGIQIHHFGDFEPSLNDIFVSKAQD